MHKELNTSFSMSSEQCKLPNVLLKYGTLELDSLKSLCLRAKPQHHIISMSETALCTVSHE